VASGAFKRANRGYAQIGENPLIAGGDSAQIQGYPQ